MLLSSVLHVVHRSWSCPLLLPFRPPGFLFSSKIVDLFVFCPVVRVPAYHLQTYADDGNCGEMVLLISHKCCGFIVTTAFGREKGFFGKNRDAEIIAWDPSPTPRAHQGVFSRWPSRALDARGSDSKVV